MRVTWNTGVMPERVHTTTNLSVARGTRSSPGRVRTTEAPRLVRRTVCLLVYNPYPGRALASIPARLKMTQIDLLERIFR